MKSCSLTHFQSKCCTHLSEFKFWCKKTSTEIKIKKKIPFSEAETMEFGQKTMNLLRSPARWPISNQKLHKFAWIWISAQNKMSTETIIFRKMPFRRLKWWNLAKMMNLLCNPTRWPISNRKAAQKNECRKENFWKITISEAEMMEFGQKTMTLL